jgi:hypothetical protein
LEICKTSPEALGSNSPEAGAFELNETHFRLLNSITETKQIHTVLQYKVRGSM